MGSNWGQTDGFIKGQNPGCSDYEDEQRDTKVIGTMKRKKLKSTRNYNEFELRIGSM